MKPTQEMEVCGQDREIRAQPGLAHREGEEAAHNRHHGFNRRYVNDLKNAATARREW